MQSLVSELHVAFRLPDVLSSSFKKHCLPFAVIFKRPVQSGLARFQSEALQRQNGISRDLSYMLESAVLACIHACLSEGECGIRKPLA